MRSTMIGNWGTADVVVAGSEVRGTIEDPTIPLTWANLAASVGIETGANLPTVNPRSSLRLPAVLACVRIIARSLAKLPLHLYRRTDTGRQRASDHELYEILRSRPHPLFSAFDWRHQLTVWRLLWGNAYAEIVRNGDGSIASLMPIEPWRVKPRMSRETMVYDVDVDGGRETFAAREIIHFRGLSLDGVKGESVLAFARKTFQTGLAAQEFEVGFNAQSMRPSAVVRHPAKLSAQAESNLRNSINEMYAGSTNAGRVLVLQEGVEATPWTMPLADAQWIERSYLSIEDVCRLFGVPPHKVQHLLRATNNNIEQQSLDFLGDTLDPDLVAMEQEIDYKLLDSQERVSLYSHFERRAAIAMDSAARANFYRTMTQIGGMNIDEVRAREEFDLLPEARGTVHYVPSSQMPAPTPKQADKVIDGWASKKGAEPAKAVPDPQTDGQAAGNTSA